VFKNVKHVEIGFNYLENPVQTVHLPESLETLILESNDITSLEILDSLQSPKYPLLRDPFCSHGIYLVFYYFVFLLPGFESATYAFSLRKISLAENTLAESLPQYPHVGLTSLNLSSTSLHSLSFLAQLSLKLPQLSSLRISTPPFSKQRTPLIPFLPCSLGLLSLFSVVASSGLWWGCGRG